MSGSGYLERRYRRLLVLYPSRYRRRHEEEILAVLMEGASPGQRRPSLSEAASLVRSGLGMRLRPGMPRSAHTVRTAVRLMYLGALLELGVLAVVAATAGRLHSAILAHYHGYTAAQWHVEFHQHIVPWRSPRRSLPACGSGWRGPTAVATVGPGSCSVSSLASPRRACCQVSPVEPSRTRRTMRSPGSSCALSRLLRWR